MNWALVGQVVTVCVIVAFLLSPLVGAWLRRRDARKRNDSAPRKVIPLKRNSDEPPPKRAA